MFLYTHILHYIEEGPLYQLTVNNAEYCMSLSRTVFESIG